MPCPNADPRRRRKPGPKPRDFVSSLPSNSYVLRPVQDSVAIGREVDGAVAAAIEAGAGIEAIGEIGESHAGKRRKLDGGYTATWESYVRIVKSCGTADTNTITAGTLRGALVFRVSQDRLSSQQLGQYASKLKAYALSSGGRVKWLVADQEYKAIHKYFIDDLQKMYPAEVERSTELTLQVLRTVYARIKPFLTKGDLWTWNFWSWLTLAFSGMLRAIDYVNRKAHLRNDQLGTAAADVFGDGKAVTVLTADLPFRKTEKGLRDINADFICIPELPFDGGIFGARRNMQQYLALQGRSIGGDERNVYQRYCKCGAKRGIVLGGVYSYEKGLSDLKWVLATAGVHEADSYGMHSARSGGLTFLLSLGVPWQTCRRLGAWKTDSAMQKSYDRRKVAVAEEVMRRAARR